MSSVIARRRRSSPLPGLGLSLGITLFWLSFIVLIPLSAVFIRSLGGGWEAFWSAAGSDRAIASYKLTFGASFIAAAINAVFGLLVAWVLVRYSFPANGCRWADDLPLLANAVAASP